MEATIILKLPCKLTKQEMKENDKALKEALRHCRCLEEHLEMMTNEVKMKKREVKEQWQKTRDLQLKFETGEEERDIECEIRYNTPKSGFKTYVRKDTGEECMRTIPMTDDEKNDLLNQPAPTPKKEPTIYKNLDIYLSKNAKNDRILLEIYGIFGKKEPLYNREFSTYYEAVFFAKVIWKRCGNCGLTWHDSVQNTMTMPEAIQLADKEAPNA